MGPSYGKSLSAVPARPAVDLRSNPTGTRVVSVVIPCRNEVRQIDALFESLFRQELPAGVELEVLIADGLSDDGTRRALQAYRAKYPALSLIDNPRKISAAGLNAAIKAARGEIIIRMDAHTEYAPDYIRECLAVLEETGADNVGGPARTKAVGYLPQAISLAYHAPFSAGGARFHDIDYEGYVDTVTYGCWRRSKLEQIGLFDEELVYNQDDELNLRICRGGGRVWQTPRIRSWYQPRSSLPALFRQYAQYGYWKVRVIQKHRLPASWRHLVPGAWAGSLIVLAAMAPFSLPAWRLLEGLLILYGLANGVATLVTGLQSRRFKFIPVLPFVFATYHLGYGYGFLRGVIDFMLLRQGGSEAFRKITRDGAKERRG